MSDAATYKPGTAAHILGHTIYPRMPLVLFHNHTSVMMPRGPIILDYDLARTSILRPTYPWGKPPSPTRNSHNPNRRYHKRRILP